MAPTNKIQDIFNVNGLVAVVTGGGTGLGLYAARALDANGAKVVYIVGRREQLLKDAAATAVNGTIKPIVGDVTDKESLKRVADQVRQEQGYINLLYANAGVMGPRHILALKKPDGSKPTVQEMQEKMLEPDMQDFTFASHVNSTAVFYTAMSFLDLLDAGNKARNLAQDSQIIVTSSIAGFSRSMANSFAYSSSKAAVTHLVKILSTVFSQNGYHIRANVIAPGMYPSEMTENAMASMKRFKGVAGHENAFEGSFVMSKEDSPSERMGSEEDFAGTILFMTSRAGAYLNGETLITDGGRLSQQPSTY
ncbi:NAD(P)-binding protein [Polychaeton citri CBS 116435]|uniref:NAD(P)-binding protein n=1 Tax=Polychaeton citri CBS 116435 TaxID=1314669 RepID=A0A9P4Q4C8_9PEZI|nr:NAD(P)-binding protein [Polychaeton citri CBS 116435]